MEVILVEISLLQTAAPKGKVFKVLILLGFGAGRRNFEAITS